MSFAVPTYPSFSCYGLNTSPKACVGNSSAMLNGRASGDVGGSTWGCCPGEWISAIILLSYGVAFLLMARFGHLLFLLPLLCPFSLGCHSQKALTSCQPLSFRFPSLPKCKKWTSVHYNLLSWALSKSPQQPLTPIQVCEPSKPILLPWTSIMFTDITDQ